MMLCNSIFIFLEVSVLKALQFFEQYNELREQLYESYPKNVSFKNGLVISYQYLGVTHSSFDNLEKALQFFEQYKNLKQELYKSYPKNVSFKNGLSIAYSFLGEFKRRFDWIKNALGL